MLALPDAFAKLRSRKDPPRLLHQNLKNIELTRRKRDFLSGPRNMAVFHIHVQVSDYQESRNMENVGRILPNTRILQTTFVVR